MIFVRSLFAAAAIALANSNAVFVKADVSNDTDDNDRKCHDLIYKGAQQVNSSPGCLLVHALFNELDIMGGTPEQVQGVCDEEPSCVAQLDTLVSQFEELECTGYTPGNAPNEVIDWKNDIDLIKNHSHDVNVLTNYFCNGNCYAVTKAVMEEGEDAATCACLLSYRVSVSKLSDAAKDYLGLTSEVDEQIKEAIDDKDCAADSNNKSNLRWSAIQSS